MKKKILSIILATAMSAALLTGCSGGRDGNGARIGKCDGGNAKFRRE